MFPSRKGNGGLGFLFSLGCFRDQVCVLGFDLPLGDAADSGF